MNGMLEFEIGGFVVKRTPPRYKEDEAHEAIAHSQREEHAQSGACEKQRDDYSRRIPEEQNIREKEMQGALRRFAEHTRAGRHLGGQRNEACEMKQQINADRESEDTVLAARPTVRAAGRPRRGASQMSQKGPRNAQARFSHHF